MVLVQHHVPPAQGVMSPHHSCQSYVALPCHVVVPAKPPLLGVFVLHGIGYSKTVCMGELMFLTSKALLCAVQQQVYADSRPVLNPALVSYRNSDGLITFDKPIATLIIVWECHTVCYSCGVQCTYASAFTRQLKPWMRCRAKVQSSELPVAKPSGDGLPPYGYRTGSR